MNAIEEVDTGGGVVITQTGVPLQRLQERVEQDGFMFPLDLGARGNRHHRRQHLHQCRRQPGDPLRHDARSSCSGSKPRLYGTISQGVRKYIKQQHRHRPQAIVRRHRGYARRGHARRAADFPVPAERQVALCALSSFDKVRALLALGAHAARRDLTAFEVMWNNYYRLTTELVGEGRRRPARDQLSLLRFCWNCRVARRRAHPDRSRKTARAGIGGRDHPRCNDCEFRCRGRGDLADLPIPSVELGRALGPGVGFDISLAIDRMEAFADAIDRGMKRIDKRCLRDRVRSCR